MEDGLHEITTEKVTSWDGREHWVARISGYTWLTVSGATEAEARERAARALLSIAEHEAEQKRYAEQTKEWRRGQW